jgi:hypothetical protein
MMRRIRAYTFKSTRSLPEILAKFGELGPWRWIERDSDRLGDYISARVLNEPDEAMVKIFIDGERFAVDLELDAEPANIEAVYATVFTSLLPAIRATDIAESEPIE